MTDLQRPREHIVYHCTVRQYSHSYLTIIDITMCVCGNFCGGVPGLWMNCVETVFDVAQPLGEYGEIKYTKTL